MYTKWGIYGYGLLFFLFLGFLSFSNVLAQNNQEAQDLSQEIEGLGIIPLIQQEPVQQKPIKQEVIINQEDSTFDSIFDFFKKIKNTDSIETINKNNKEKIPTKTGKNQSQTNTGGSIITGGNNISGNTITGEYINTGKNTISIDQNNPILNDSTIEKDIQYNEKSFDYDIFLSNILAKYYGSYTYEEHLNPKLCHYTTGDIISIKPGKNNLPEYLSGGTIYKLRDGDYISDYMIKINDNCTMIIGSRESRLLTKNTEGATIKVISGQNNIFENLILEGEENGSKKPHIANNYGIYLDSSKNIINNITSFDQVRFAIYMNSFENHIINSLFLKEPIILEIGDTLLNTGDILLDTGDTTKKLFLEKIIQDKYKQTKVADKINKKMQFSATNNPAQIDTNKPNQEIESDLIWNLFTKKKEKFKGKSSLNLEKSKGKIPVDIILESLDSKHKVHLKKNSILKKKNGDVYTGIFIIPEETPEIGYSTGTELSGSKLKSAQTIKIGSFEEGIYITNNSGEKQEAIIEMSVTGYKSGDNVEIFSSEDGENRESLGYYEVQEKNGESFVLIPITHFSYISAGTYYGNYFKGTITINESFHTFEIPQNCHYSINGGIYYSAIFNPGLNGITICSTMRSDTSNFNIKFRLSVDGGLLEEPRSFLNPDMLLVTGTTYYYGSLDTYYYDNTAPFGGSFTINNGDTYTKSTTVTLNITCPSDSGVGGVQMMFSYNGSTRTTPENCANTKSYNLLAGEGSQTVYMRFLDRLGNTTTNRIDSIIVDTTNPTYGGFSFVSGPGTYQDGNTYWVRGREDSQISFKITHSDNYKVGTQYFSLTSGSSCTPNNCGGAPYEIKSYNNGSHINWMSYNDYLDIYSSNCSDPDGNCTDNDLTRTWLIRIGRPPDLDFRMRTFIYDEASNGLGYTSMNAWLKIDSTAPVTTINSPIAGSRQGSSINMGITDTDTRSGIGSCTYTIKSNGTTTLSNGTRTCNSSLNINTSTYCPTQGSNKCEVLLTSYDNVGMWSLTTSRLFSIDTVTPSTSISPNGTTCTASNPSVTLTCSDATAGCSTRQYKIVSSATTCNTSSLSTYSSAFSVNGTAGAYTQSKVCYRSSDNAGNYESIKTSSVYNIDKIGPTVPSQSSPASAARTNDTTPTLSWSASSDQGCSSVSQYYAGIYTNSTCTTLNQGGWVSAPTTNYTPSTALSNGTYYRKVYARDALGNNGSVSSCRSFIVDTTAPTITISNPNTNPATSKTITASTNEGTLTMTAGSTSTTCNATRSFIAYASTTFSSEADNGKRICYRAIDSAGNISYKLSNAIAGIDTTAPTTTDNANNTRRSSDFSVTLTPNETSTTKYCIGTSSCSPTTIGTTANVTCTAGTTCASQYVRYYSTDTAGNAESIKTSSQIRIDKQVPSFTFANASGPECVNGSLAITSASDGGVGLHSTPYSFNGSTWNTTTSTTITAQQPGTQNRTAYVKDALGNSTSKAATFTFTNIAPTANNFVGHSSVGNTPRTVNWKTSSSANEGSCGNGSITYNTVITQGTKGSCSVVGDNITYTPNTSQAGSDSCVIQLKDNENSTVNITVSWNGIDTVTPNSPTCTDGKYFTSSISVSCSTAEGTMRYTTNGTTPTCSSSSRSNQAFSATTTLRIGACDSAGNISTIKTYVYTKDTTNPGGTYGLNPSSITNNNVTITFNPTDNFGVKSIQLPDNSIVTGLILPTLINPNNWVVGTTGSQPGFTANQTTVGENTIILKKNPRGIVDTVWASERNDSTSNGDGGWRSSTFSIDKTKKYRSVVWIRRENPGNGRTYFGTLANHVANLSNGTTNTNPYFKTFLISDITEAEDHWLLLVAYIHPYTYASTSSDPTSGIYTIDGRKITNNTDFKRTSTATSSNHRTYLYYSTSQNERQYRYRPRFEVVDGNEPSISDLLAGKEQASSVDYTATTNGTYNFIVRDRANNSATIGASVTNIDKTAPTTTDNANSARRNSDFSVTLTPNETSTTRYCIGTNSCSPTTIGTTANVTCSADTTCASQYVRYYSTDTAGNTESVKTSSQIRIDKQAPSFTFANTSGPECVNGSLAITSASDGGVGLHATPYSFNGSTWNTTTSTTITAQQPGTQNKTAYVRDSLGNSSSKTATYTFNNTVPTASNFIGHSSVGNTARTVNWKTLSSANEGTCGNSSITYNSIVTQGTKGSCSVVGDNITYTPNTSQAGSDSCVIQLKDNENSTVNITVSWEGIDTIAPTEAPTCTNSQYFSSSLAVTCTVGAGGTQVRYTTNGVDPSPSSPIWSNQFFSSTTTLKAISCDALNNCNLNSTGGGIYTLDNLAPTSSISDTNSNWRNTNISFTLNSSDAGVGGITSYYKSLAGDITCTAGGFSVYSTSVSVNGTDTQAIQRTICYYSKDSLGNTETIRKQLYKIDMSDPSITAPAIYGGTTYGTYFKGTIDLRSSISDIGAGILSSSCMRSINSAAWTNVGVTQDTSYCMYNTYNPTANFNIKFLVKDQATNTGISNQSDFTYDNTAPTIGTPAIYAGTTYNNTYFKGTISIQSTATDAGSNIDTNTCEYSINNGSSRTSATYAGGYCQISNISPATNIQILIRAKDNLDTIGISSVKTYTYDATAPITTDNASSTRTNSDQTITLSPTDAGAGVANTYYCITNSGGTCTPNIAGTSVLVTGANNEITNKQIRYYSTDNLNTDEIIKTSEIINIDKQGPTVTLLSPENNSGFNDGSPVQLQWSGSDNGGGMSGYIYNILSGGSSIISGFTTNTAIIVSGLNIGIYNWSITAIDIIGNQTISPERSFEIKQLNYVIIPDSEINADFITAFTEVGYIDSGDILIGSKDINLETSTNGKICPGKNIGFISTGTLYGDNIEIELPTCFYVKKSNGSPYTGLIKIPEFIDNISPNNLLLNKSTINVGTGTESIFFKNESNNDINAIIRVPTPEKQLGETIKIFYSENGQDRNYLTSTNITSYKNQPYAIFENNHFTYFSVGAIQRSTDNYLNKEFWNNNPTNDQILKALYGDGSGSVYTQNRIDYADNCTGNTVIHTGILPSEFSANTVYVLESGNYDITGQINVRNCAAIISSGNVTISSQADLSYLLYNTTKYSIIDNISRNGNNFTNSRGIDTTFATSNTINNFKSYNNTNGIQISSNSNNNSIINSEFYNNGYGLQIHDSSNNIVNNVKTYNNTDYGIGITRYNYNSSYNSINNVQSFNNIRGIYLYSNYVYQNTISNSSFYNNSYGISFISSPQNNNLVNIESYNNTYDPIAGSSTTNKYYGFLNIYGYTEPINYLNITQGTGGAVLDWTTGSIYTGEITIQNKITNPINNSGIYLLDRNNINKQRVISWTGSIPPITYSYGSEIIKQKQPMKYSGSSIIYYGISGSDRDTSKFIGTNKEPSNGSVAINEASPTTDENITVTFTATNNMNWYLFGDITTNLNGIILANQSITTGVILSGDSGYKNVFIQLQTGDTEITHYMNTIQYEADSIAPTVSTGYITVGTTGINGSDLYYKGTISIKSDISDNIAINSGSCEYSLTGTRYTASGTDTYCEVTNITPNEDIDIQFRVQDMVGNIGTGPLQTYLYDNTPPTGGSFNINNGDLYTSGTNLNLDITCATDTGINGIEMAYGTGVDPDNWTTCTTPIGLTVDSINETKIIYVRFKDSFDNITSNIVQSIILDTTNPSITFTGSTPADNTITSDTSFSGEVEITEENIGSFTRNRNGINYPIYDSGLVLMMNFDNVAALGETTLGIIKDLSNYNNNITPYNTLWTENGKYNGGYYLDGDDDYIVIGTTGVLQDVFDDTFTISFWYKHETCNNSWCNIIDKPYISHSTPYYQFDIRQLGDKIYSNIYQSGVLAAYLSTARNTSLIPGQWHYITVTTNITNSQLKLYINGLLDAQDLSSNGEYYNWDSNITIGGLGNGPTWNYNASGIIDEFRIYNRVLSSGEIQQLYNSNISKYDTDKWLFNFTESNLTDGSYTYLASISDIVNNTTSTETRTITIDQTGPEIIFTGSTPADNSIITGNHFSGFAEITETNLSSLTRNRNGINYPIYDSGLVLMMNFNNVAALGESEGIIKDLSIYGNNGTGINNPSWTSNGKFGGAYEFNGINSYIDESNNAYNFEFTKGNISLWFKGKENKAQYLIGGGNNSNRRGLGIGGLTSNYNNESLCFVKNTPTGYVLFMCYRMGENYFMDDKRHFVGVSINGINNTLYVDGEEKEVSFLIGSKNTSGYFTNENNNLFFIGKRSYTGAPAYFSGQIDEVRIYNRALSSGEIQQLYNSNLSKYDTDKRQFTTEQSCLIDSNYNYSVSATDTFNNQSSTGRSFTIQLPNPTVGTPTYGLNLPEITNGLEDQTIEQSFTGEDNNFWIYDTKGYTGWYTTIQLSGGLLNPDGTHEITQDNIQFKADPTITTIEGQTSTAIALATGMDEYKTMTGIYNYIIKNYTPECSSCIIGKYGNTPSLKVTIPAFQKADTYNGTIIFTLYN